jgi:hypothetical protein
MPNCRNNELSFASFGAGVLLCGTFPNGFHRSSEGRHLECLAKKHDLASHSGFSGAVANGIDDAATAIVHISNAVDVVVRNYTFLSLHVVDDKF